MKKLLYTALAATLTLLGGCSEDNDPVTITTDMGQVALNYNDDGTWTEVASNNTFALQGLQFAHEGEISPWGLTWNGFTPARYAGLDYSAVTSWLQHQFQVPTRGGMSGTGTPYVVAFWDTQENESTPADDRSCRIYYRQTPTSEALPFTPKDMHVQLTCYTMHAITDGNDFCRPFDDGDWLRLTAHGVHADGTEVTTDILLADYTGDTPMIADSWTRMELSGLGTITELYFTLSSSDTGRWGMNTPSYFALDRLTFTAVLP